MRKLRKGGLVQQLLSGRAGCETRQTGSEAGTLNLNTGNMDSLRVINRPGEVVHSFSPGTQRQRLCESEEEWSTWRVLGQPELHSMTLLQKTKQKENNH